MCHFLWVKLTMTLHTHTQQPTGIQNYGIMVLGRGYINIRKSNEWKGIFMNDKYWIDGNKINK